MCPKLATIMELTYFLGFSPLTSALKSAPGRNLGTEDFGTSMVAPVAGLRAVRAGRSLFSKTPNPVMATLSPLATADWMVSSTAFKASVADFLSPNRPEIASIRSRLFIVHSCASPTGRVGSGTIPRPLTCPKVGDPAPLHNNHGQIGRRVGQYPTPSSQQIHAKYPGMPGLCRFARAPMQPLPLARGGLQAHHTLAGPARPALAGPARPALAGPARPALAGPARPALAGPARPALASPRGRHSQARAAGT